MSTFSPTQRKEHQLAASPVAVNNSTRHGSNEGNDQRYSCDSVQKIKIKACTTAPTCTVIGTTAVGTSLAEGQPKHFVDQVKVVEEEHDVLVTTAPATPVIH